MKKKLAYLGLDVHKNSITMALLEQSQNKIKFTRKVSSNKKLLHSIKGLDKDYDLRICYEAGCTGYSLYRKLIKEGFICYIVAPSSIPLKMKKVKTDKIDAENLAKWLKSGNLSYVNVPDEDSEMDRDVIHFRESIMISTKKVKQQIKSFLLRKDVNYDELTWTKKSLNWLGTLELELKDRMTLDLYLGHLNYLLTLQLELNSKIEDLAQSIKYNDQVIILCGFRGISTLTAMTILTHIADFRMFSNPQHLSSFIGLVPGESSSGDSRKSLPITKHGNSFLRKAFVNASQHYIAIKKVSPSLKLQRDKLSSTDRAIVDRADRRLRKVFNHLTAKGKHINTAKTAVARELVHFIWEVMIKYHNGEILEPPTCAA